MGEVHIGGTRFASLSGADLARNRLSRASRFMSNLVVVVALAWLGQTAFFDAELQPSAMRTLIAGSSALAASLLLLNLRLQHTAPGEDHQAWQAWLIYGGLGAGAVILFLLLAGLTGPRTLPLALASWLIVASVGAAVALLERLRVPPVLAVSLASALAALATTAPLWLGPASELAQRAAIVNSVLAVSPLTFLAVIAEFDYLRTGWFYEHSVLGALRYEYPSAWLLYAAYTLLPAIQVCISVRNQSTKIVTKEQLT